jgi:transcriptional regulator with XRE-family HTH domain
MAISPAQMKAARKLLGWSQDGLAGECGVSSATISKYETQGETTGTLDLTVARRMLSDAGIEFRDREEPTVRLRIVRATWDPPPE